MACPYFYPLEEADFTARPRPARAPLGGVFAGQCRASVEAFEPPDRLLYEVCNFGNGRGVCPRFPAESDGDSVRFTEWKGALLYVVERSCSPVAHGVCDESLPPILARQAEVFRGRH